MLRDNLVELIEPMLDSAGADPLALYIHTRTPASDDRLPCLKNPRPEGAESSLTESASSPFQAEPAHLKLTRSVSSRGSHRFDVARSRALGRTGLGLANRQVHCRDARGRLRWKTLSARAHTSTFRLPP